MIEILSGIVIIYILGFYLTGRILRNWSLPNTFAYFGENTRDVEPGENSKSNTLIFDHEFEVATRCFLWPLFWIRRLVIYVLILPVFWIIKTFWRMTYVKKETDIGKC